MANFFRKRKIAVSPNKNEAKVRRARESEDRERSAGRLGERFPSVQSLTVQLSFSSSHHASLGEETRAFGPQDACRFTVSCPGACGAGSFDLDAKLEQIVVSRQAAAEANGQCREPLYAGSPDICGCELKCAISVVYFPQPAPPAST